MSTHRLNSGQEKFHAIKALHQQIGLWLTIRCCFHVLLRSLLDPPFKDLGKPQTHNEVASRRQIADAVIIYGFLKHIMGQTRALEATSTVIVASGQFFIDAHLSDINHARLVEIDEPARRELASERLSRFPNMTPKVIDIREDALRFRVERCHFVHLCSAAGVPELTQAFCKVDDVYFSEIRDDIELVRPQTLARDNRPCEFHLQFRPKDDAKK